MGGIGRFWAFKAATPNDLEYTGGEVASFGELVLQRGTREAARRIKCPKAGYRFPRNAA